MNTLFAAPPPQAIPNLLAREALNKIDSLSPQNISNMLWSFVYMHHYNEPLLRAMAALVKGKVEQFKPQELANVLWAMASLEFNDPEMVQVRCSTAALLLAQVWSCARFLVCQSCDWLT